MCNKCYLKKIICIFLSAILLASCGFVSEFSVETLQNGGEEDGPATLGLTPAFDYEVPESLPNILVDQVGYELGSNKLAVIQGEMPPDYFTILEAESGREVYTGKIEQKGYDWSSDVCSSDL